MELHFKLWLESLNPDNNMFWISPKGEILSVGTKHIDMIINSPETFGLTKEQIQQVFQKHNEPMGSEGNAREELMADLLKQGWIRIRKYRRPDFWSVQGGKLDHTFYTHMIEWIHGMAVNKTFQYSDIVATTYDMSDTKRFTAGDFLKGRAA